MDQEQRPSSVPPSIELLPHIKTSEDRADEWLERGMGGNKMDVDEGDLGVQKVAKAYQVLGVKRDGDFRWDWKTGRVESTKDLPKTR